MRTADYYQAMWDLVERIWADTTARPERLPEAARSERVDGEWSFAETLRHLVLATDAWASHRRLGSRTVLAEPMPYHRLGVTHTPYPPADAAALGIDLDARPSFAEVLTEPAGWRWCAALWTVSPTPTANSNGSAPGARAGLPRGIALGWPLPARGDDGGMRAPLPGARPRGAGSATRLMSDAPVSVRPANEPGRRAVRS